MKEKQKLNNGNNIYAVILARSGSKSIKNKNLQLILNKPLIFYSISEALKSKSISKVYFLTDSKKYAKIAMSYGAIIPFIRPNSISNDNSKDIDTFKYFFKWLNKNKVDIPKIFVHLRATAPLVQSKDIDKAVNIFLNHKNCDSLKSVNISKNNPFKMWKENTNGFLKPIIKLKNVKEPWNEPRQKLPKILFQNAQIDIFKSELLNKNTISGNKIIPFVIDNYIDIDNKFDLIEAEIKLQIRNNIKKIKINSKNLK